MLLIIAAAPLETALLRNNMSNIQISLCGAIQVFTGQLNGRDVLLSHGGIGQVNMAMQLTRLLNISTPDTVFLCGCGGSYPGSGLKIGDLALATSEFYADLGVATAEKFIPLEELDLPQNPQLSPLARQSFSLDKTLLEQAQRILPDAACGPFATVNCCSGHPDLSFELEKRSGAICENMEGAAAAQVCTNFAAPLLELRGISNPTGTRNPQQWDVIGGAEAAQKGILELLKHWPNN
jgi:futalosine hydrolase